MTEQGGNPDQQWPPRPVIIPPPPPSPDPSPKPWRPALIIGVTLAVLIAAGIGAKVLLDRDNSGPGPDPEPVGSNSSLTEENIAPAIPAGLSLDEDCSIQSDVDPPAVKLIRCTSTSPRVPQTLMLYGYTSTDDLQDRFRVNADGLLRDRANLPCPGSNPGSGPGAKDWENDSRNTSGQYVCGRTDRGEALLIWTEEQTRTMGVAFLGIPGDSDQAVAQNLRVVDNWWRGIDLSPK